MLEDKLNTSRFLRTETNGNRSETQENKQWKPHKLNTAAAFFHGLQCIVVIFIIIFKTSKINPDFVFISPQRELIWQNYALIKADTKEPTCPALQNNALFNDKSQWKPNIDMVEHNIFNFNNTVLIPFYKRGVIIHLDIMIALFFFLSFAFQWLNGYILNKDPSFPRIINYMEYSVSASLMIIALAVNMGIAELYTITSLAGLFFGMNILGACTEIILHLNSETGQTKNHIALYVFIPQCAAWLLFLFAIIPILTQFTIIRECSNTGVPAHVYLAIVLQTLFFCLFGIAQTWSTTYRLQKPANSEYAIQMIDNTNIILSFVAKTCLAWSLLSPALSVKDGALKQ